MTGEHAKHAGVNVEAIRIYERKGLLPIPPRLASGYRVYPPGNVQRLRIIKRAGSRLLARRDPRPPRAPGPAEARSLAEAKLEDIRRKIADLRAIERALKELTDACSGRGPLGECPILQHLGGRP
jgi:MerR family mercuric resistance operon transcriptional regulator